MEFNLIQNLKEIFHHDLIPFGSKSKRKLSPQMTFYLVQNMKKISFPFNFEPNGIPIGSNSKEKLAPRFNSIEFERKHKSISLTLP